MDLDAFKRTLRYQRSAAPAQILADLDELRQFDRTHEALVRRWRRLTIGGFLLMFFGAFFAGPLTTILPPAIPAATVAVLPIGFLLFGIVAVIQWQRWKKFDLVDARYQTLAALCSLVRADLPADATVEVSLDFNAVEQKALLQAQRARGRWKCKLYVQPWLRARGRFVDGTRFDVRAAERREVRVCWATGRSGKSKRKRKVKAGTVLDVSLAPKPDRTGDLAAHAQRLSQAVKLPPEARLLRTRAAPDALELRASVASATASLEHPLAMMLLSLYQVVGFAQAQRRSAGA